MLFVLVKPTEKLYTYSARFSLGIFKGNGLSERKKKKEAFMGCTELHANMMKVVDCFLTEPKFIKKERSSA